VDFHYFFTHAIVLFGVLSSTHILQMANTMNQNNNNNVENNNGENNQNVNPPPRPPTHEQVLAIVGGP
jgi:hypothetical protein